MQRKLNGFSVYVCGLSLLIAYGAYAADLAIYAGPPNGGWISPASVARETADVEAGLSDSFESMTTFRDGDEVGYDSPLGLWLQGHTGNGVTDVIVLTSGTMPSALYQFPNVDPDGSRVEEFLDGGNVVVNIADWFGYMSYEGGSRSADNGAAGAANIFDIPGLSFGSRVNSMVVNDAGRQYLPSLVDFSSARPWHLEQFAGTDWTVTTFADAGPNDADPAVAVNSVTGGVVAALMQKDWPDPSDAEDIRGDIVVEFVNNWLTDQNILVTTAVEAEGKAASTWGELKAAR